MKWFVAFFFLSFCCYVLCREIPSLSVHQADTYARIKWTVDESDEDKGVISYYEITIKDKALDTVLQSFEKNLSTAYPDDDVVFDDLEAGKTYKVTVVGKVTTGDDVSASVSFTTYDNLNCDFMETWAAFLSGEIYGPVQYPEYKFCGQTWQTYYATQDLEGTNRDMVLYNVDQKLAMVVFRGTIVTFADWFVNFELGFNDCDKYVFNGECEGQIHEGFGDEYLRSRDNIRSYLADLLQGGFNRVIVTGHSQGAALATVAAADLYAFAEDQLGAGAFEIRPITMGSPRVGDGDFADDFDLKLGGLTDQSTLKSCRFVAEGENDIGDSVEDLVTKVPLNDVPGFDYKHVITKVLVDFGDEECTLTGKEGNIPCHAISKYFEAVSTLNAQQAADFSVTTGTVDESSLRPPALAHLVLETRPQLQQSSIFSTIFSSTTGFFSSSSPSAGGSSTSAASSLNGGLNMFVLVVVTLFACAVSML